MKNLMRFLLKASACTQRRIASLINFRLYKKRWFFILRGDTLHKGKGFHIWIIYLLNEFDLNLMDNLDGSVIIRFYPKDSNKPQWRWLKYPSLEKKNTSTVSVH